jgi:uncharacterized protein YaaQ
MLVIVQSEDAADLLEQLTRQGYRATRINTAGGFLKTGNVTVFLGVEDDQIPPVCEIIQQQCRTRTQLMTSLPTTLGPDALLLVEPVEVEIGGATIFVLDVDQFERL